MQDRAVILVLFVDGVFNGVI